MHHGRTSASVKLHSWVTAFGQQGTEAERGRSVNFGDSWTMFAMRDFLRRGIG